MSISQIPSGWTITRSDERIVVQHVSGSFYAAAKEGDSGIAESILYMLADSLLNATLSPAHIEDEREAAIAQFAQTFPMTSESAAGGNPNDIELRRYYLLGWDDRAALSAPPAAGAPEGWKLVPVEPTAEMQAAGATAIRFETTPINKLFTGNAVYRAAISAAPTPPASEQQRAVVIPEITGTAIVEVVNGAEGPSLYIGNEDGGYRLAGPKPWGGGRTIHRFTVKLSELVREAMDLAKGEGV